ncbi:MAG: DUF3047 domain-containing protein [Burkholderiales bacterium]|nr:DUF3047 domain-containing protein [Burkholderiales bacterium]
MKTRLTILALLSLSMPASGTDSPPPFSSLAAGQVLPKEFRILTLPKIAANKFALVTDEGTTVLRVDSDHGAGSLALPLTTSAGDAPRLLEWRWKVSRVLDKADMRTKPGDDFSARVYVFFDVAMDSLSFADRTRLRLARMIAAPDVPTAALCYVWDNKYAVGYTQWSAYSNRAQMIVLQSGSANIGKWMTESRDIAADFRAAFGFDAPAVTGVAVGNDTDNTGELVSTWFGDVSLKKK